MAKTPKIPKIPKPPKPPKVKLVKPHVRAGKMIGPYFRGL